jgi:hypothetical protein
MASLPVEFNFSCIVQFPDGSSADVQTDTVLNDRPGIVCFVSVRPQAKDSFGGALHLTMTLAELDLIDSHMQQLDEELAALLRVHQAAVQRLAAVPGFGVDSAQQIIEEVGPTATTFPTAKHPASRAAIAKCVDYSTKQLARR